MIISEKDRDDLRKAINFGTNSLQFSSHLEAFDFISFICCIIVSVISRPDKKYRIILFFSLIFHSFFSQEGGNFLGVRFQFARP